MREIDRQTDKQTRQTDKTDRQTDRQDRQIEIRKGERKRIYNEQKERERGKDVKKDVLPKANKHFLPFSQQIRVNTN